LAETILVLGATGLFGGHVARQLIADGHDVVVAARSEAALVAFVRQDGGRAQALDRDDHQAVVAALDHHRPSVVIDVAGPFQNYGPDPYRFAQLVLQSGAHYLDLADASGFVAGISALDALAREQGVTALSGASSTPALSSAAADALVSGLTHVDEIETAILPGNRTERGLSVIRAILGQVGQPYRMMRGGAWEEVHGWDETRRIAVVVGGRRIARFAALNETPEVALFPQLYKARTVIFRAGLELWPFHFGLAALRWPVRFGWVDSLGPLSGAVLAVSRWLKRLGSDTGGMAVRVLGRTGQGWERRAWTLIAPDGVGPKIPEQPAVMLARKLLSGGVQPGARPATGALTLAELEAAMARFGVVTETRSQAVVPVFRQVLGPGFDGLAAPVRALHDRLGIGRFSGRADIDGPQGWQAALAARIAGFPPTARGIPVSVTIDAT
jgi:hypothetical protein